MEFRLLGPLEARESDEPVDLGPFKQRALLALLLINANEVVSTDRILEELWGEEAEGKESALWVHISRLRSALEPGRSRRGESTILVTREPGYVLLVDPGSTDAAQFEEMASRGRSLLLTDPSAAAEVLEEALSLWRGPALDDMAYESFAQIEIERLAELRLGAQEDRIDADLARGQAGELISEIESMCGSHPLRGRPVGQLMLALHRSGRQAEALRAFERFRMTLANELGIEPSAELRRLEEQILVQDDRLARPVDRQAASTTVRAIENPFKGLRAFREEDSDDFYGRDHLVAEMVRVLGAGQPLVAVVGPSGSGKSSLVRAGLVPALRKGALPESDRWLIAQMVPGAHPFAEAESALLRSTLDAPDSLRDHLSEGDDGLLRAAMRLLPDDSSKLVLVVDQFEELFTLVEDEASRSRFLENLVTAINEPHHRVQVVLTLRADLYDKPLAYPEFGSMLGNSVVNVTPLSAEELESAAVSPATEVGVQLEPALVGRLIADVAGEPNALPLFQYTLTELFDRRESDTLTSAEYQDLGGLHGALSRQAEAVYQELDAGQQQASRQLFLRLVTVSGDDERARRRVPASEIISLGVDVVTMQRVLEGFGSKRLLTFDADPVTGAPTIEVAHEALLTHWERLRGWIDEHQGDLHRLASYRIALEEWRLSGEQADYLLTGSRLAETEQWVALSEVELTPDEQRFLVAGIEHREEQQGEELERKQREVKRLRGALVGVGVALVIALVAGLFAFVERNRADDATSAAETRRMAADAALIVESDRRLALLLAAEAYKREPSAETLSAVQRVLTATGEFLGYAGSGNAYLAVEWADSNDVIVALGRDSLDVYSTESLELSESYPVEPTLGSSPVTLNQVGSLDVSADGRFIAVATTGGTTLVDRLSQATSLLAHPAEVVAVKFSEGSRLLATGTRDGVVRLWGVPAAVLEREIVAHTERTWEDLGDLVPGELPFWVGPYDDSARGVGALLFVDEDRVLVSTDGPVVRQWNLVDGALVVESAIFAPEINAPINHIRLESDPNDSTILRNVTLGGVGIISRADGSDLGGLEFPTDRTDTNVLAPGAALLPDGSGWVVFMSDGRVQTLDVAGGRSSIIDSEMRTAGDVDVAPDGARYVAAGSEGLMIGALDGSELLAIGVPKGPGTELSISLAGDLVVSAETAPGMTTVLEVAPDGTATPFEIEPAFADRPTYAEAGSGDRYLSQFHVTDEGVFTVNLIDRTTGDDTGFVAAPTGVGIAFSPDGRLIATGKFPGTSFQVRQIETSGVIAEPAVFADPNCEPCQADRLTALDFNRDGSRLVATTESTARVFDTSDWSRIETPLGEEPFEVVRANYSPDGSWLATLDSEGTMSLRDPETHEILKRLVGGGPPSEPFAVGPVFSIDGRYVLSTWDGSARMWDIESETLVGVPFPNDLGVVTNGADGDPINLVSAVGEHMKLWNLDTDTWAEIACRAAGRNMTPEEWEAFGPTDTGYRATCEQYPLL